MRPAVMFTLDAHPSSGIVEREPWRAAPRPRYTAAELAKAPLGFFALGRDGLPPTRCRILREPSQTSASTSGSSSCSSRARRCRVGSRQRLVAA